MGTSMESLIHHFKLVTEGFRVPAGPGLPAVESRQGRARRPPGVSDGGTRPYRAHFRDPSFNNLQADGRDVRGRPDRRRHRRRRVDRPGDGRRGPLMPATGDARRVDAARLRADADAPDRRALPAGALGAAAAAAPGAERGGLRQPARHRVLRRRPGPDHGRGVRRRDVLHAVQAPPQRRVHRRRLHQHALRDHGRRPDLRRAVRAPRASGTTRPPTDGAITLERVECNAACDFAPVRDGQLGVLRQPDAGDAPASWSTTCRPAQTVTPTRGAVTVVHLQGGLAGARRVRRRPRRRGCRRGRRRRSRG